MHIPTSLPSADRIAIYIRTNVDEPADQLRRCKEYLVGKGILAETNLDGVLCYRDFGAAHLYRPELTRLLCDAEKGSIDLVVIADIQSVSPSIVAFFELTKLLKANKVGLIALRECIDTSTASGALMMRMMVVLAEMEREGGRVSEQVG